MPADRRHPSTRTDPSPEAVRRTTRPVLWFAVLLLAALWFSATAPPWPLPLLSGVLALAAGVFGIRGLIAMRHAKMGAAMVVLVVLGLLLAAALVFLNTVQAIMWPVYAEFHECLTHAITSRAERACTANVEVAVQDWVWDLFRSS